MYKYTVYRLWVFKISINSTNRNDSQFRKKLWFKYIIIQKYSSSSVAGILFTLKIFFKNIVAALTKWNHY